MREHQKTYAMFTGLTKWGTILCMLVVVGMALFLV